MTDAISAGPDPIGMAQMVRSLQMNERAIRILRGKGMTVKGEREGLEGRDLKVARSAPFVITLAHSNGKSGVAPTKNLRTIRTPIEKPVQIGPASTLP